ncbi:DUF1080 domain-containing protein [Candidatus Latescibacterota bacterium]
MKKLLSLIICAAILFSPAVSADFPPVNDGNFHGDPPYLLEDGWTQLLNGTNLDGWEYMEPEKGEWAVTGGVYWGGAGNPEQLTAVPGPGDRMYNTASGTNSASNIFTTQKFGDLELYVEFMIAGNSNSGVYVHGLYEFQIWDSFGKDLSDQITDICGAAYNYEFTEDQMNAIRAKGERPRYAGGIAPLVRADRPAGQWQSFHIWFRAPRFDSSGNKTANAAFLRVLHNGVLIHETVERTGPTRAPMKIKEAAKNPIMLQGDHGAIAFRNIYIRPLRPFVQK